MKHIHRDFDLKNDIKLLKDKLISLEGNNNLLFPDGHKEKITEVSFLQYSKNRKYDALINGKRFRIRCISFYDNALINHSTREKYSKVCGKLGLDISELDEMVNEYWKLRLTGIIKEDIDNSSPDCPFLCHKEYLSKLLTWFAFHSLTTVNGISDNSCDFILDFEDPEDEKTWVIYDESNYFETIWKHLRFSIRDTKGMPKHYDPSNRSFDEIKPWVHKLYGRYKGALHVRINAANHYNASQPSFEKANEVMINNIKANNNGERDELLFKLYLIHLRMKDESIWIKNERIHIESIGNTNEDNYLDLPCDVSWNTITPTEIVAMSMMVKVKKSSGGNKADIFINHTIGISIKSEAGSPPSIINQTRRTGMLSVVSRLKLPIGPLDNMVNNYWSARENRQIAEDVAASDNCNPFNDRDYLYHVLTYFSFVGTAKGDSIYPADYILSFKNPLNSSTWKYYGKDEYIPEVWDKLIFSLRTKGLPKNISETDEQWIRIITNKDGESVLSGTLNVRVGSK